MTTISPNGRGLFYHRDSNGTQEAAPKAYFQWAQREALKYNVALDGSVEDVETLIQQGGGDRQDIYLDYGVEGNLLSRPAFDRLCRRIQTDSGITHLFIPRRDRLARPDQASEGMRIEESLRSSVVIVYTDRVLSRLATGERQDIGTAVQALIDFDNSGRFRDEHARKMLHARNQLAQAGFSGGGRAPYGYRRALFRNDELVRILEDGEIVRQQGHHVQWIPGPEHETQVILRILEMLKRISANQVARILNQEGIPSPNHGRMRKKRMVSGVWSRHSVSAIARQPRIRGAMTNGRRSTGDRARFTPNGPRDLGAADRGADGQPRTVRNAPEDVVVVPLADRLISEEESQELDRILDARSNSQKGKQRSRTPDSNPLGARIIDMNCGWRMYRNSRGEQYRYLCGLYHQSAGARCACNYVRGPEAVGFVMAYLRQRLFVPNQREKLITSIRRRAEELVGQSADDQSRERFQERLAEIEEQIGRAEENLARATTDAGFRAMERQLERLVNRKAETQHELAALATEIAPARTAQQMADDAIARIDELAELAADSANLPQVVELFRRMDVKLYLRFGKVQKGKRPRCVVAGGILTVGAVESPIEVYSGPTSQKLFAEQAKKQVSEQSLSSREAKSIRNGSHAEA